MTLQQSLYVMRRWRSAVVAGALIGILVGWTTAPGTTAATITFQAVHTVIIKPEAQDFSALNRATVLVSLGAVPTRVATRLGIDRRVVQSTVFVETPNKTGTLLIIGRSADRAQAEALANTSAEELIIELGGQNSPLQTLEPAVASPVETGDIRPPTSRPSRALLLGGFGLLLGIGAAFALDRFDKRIRSRSAAAEALAVPVLADVPALSRPERGQLVLPAQPSPFIEAYRGLRTRIDRWIDSPGISAIRPVIVVTSPTGGEGTTTTVAHLAAALGEIGRTVLVISADLRRPQLHFYFGKAREPGLSDVLRGAPDASRLTDLSLGTSTRGVRFVASGAPVRNPAPLLDRIGYYLDDARSLGDLVLVDAPPLLTTSDGADLARHADGVLLVLRSGRTAVGPAARSVELLEQLEIPVLGAVLVGSDGPAVRT